MIYCVSDIHGQYKKFLKLLHTLQLKEEDSLYVLGDVCDRGPYSMQILLRMMEYPNIIPLCGNHDYMAARCLRLLSQEITEEFLDHLDDVDMGIMDAWLQGGGQATMKNFGQLTTEEKADVLDYLDEFNLYEEVTVNGQDYILVHAGLQNFSPERPLDDYEPFELIEGRPDYSKPYYPDKIVVSGHTPTQLIPENPVPGRIYKANHHIAIDCGCTFGGPLAAICLDNGKEFYIE